MPRQARLRGRVQFTGSFTSRRQGKFLVVSRRGGAAGMPARLGMVVGRQAAPLSVTRSLVKRSIREVFRRLRPQLGSIDVVVRVRQLEAKPDIPALRNELERLLRETS
ncbi:MAG TPA: ribonuclease P protein component [Burkholderiales bacterium]|nr:ribonuclease P protein component [Burkholderiales bacterium]